MEDKRFLEERLKMKHDELEHLRSLYSVMINNNEKLEKQIHEMSSGRDKLKEEMRKLQNEKEKAITSMKIELTRLQKLNTVNYIEQSVM